MKTAADNLKIRYQVPAGSSNKATSRQQQQEINMHSPGWSSWCMEAIVGLVDSLCCTRSDN